jgi:hypothetical protein
VYCELHHRVARLLQRPIAGRVGAVGDDHQRGAGTRPAVEHRRRLRHRVVDGGAAGRLHLAKHVPQRRRRARPRRSQARAVVEEADERLVLAAQQIADEVLDG